MGISEETEGLAPHLGDPAAKLAAALRQLTANLLRVVGGAGRAEDLQGDAERFIAACNEYEAAVGERAWLQIDQSIDLTCGVPHRPWTDRLNQMERARHGPRETMLLQAMRVTAARIMKQRSHEVVAEAALVGAAERYADVPAALAKAEKDRLRIIKADLARKTASRRREGTAIRREP